MRVLLGKIYFRIKVFLLWIKEYIWQIQLFVAICVIVFCSYLLCVWYKVPVKSVTYAVKTYGCIGYPKCKIIGSMNYGNDIEIDSSGFVFILYHPLRVNSPSLFNGDMSGTMRRKTYTTEYEPLCYKYCSVIDSVSTLYKSIISIESNLYDTVKTKDKEKWENKREVTIWCHSVSIKNRNVSENECWFFMKRMQKNWNIPIDTIEVTHGLKTDLDNFSPKWYSVGDASKLVFRLNLKLRNLIDCQEILIKFNGPFTLASITMEPDNKGYNYISFTNPYKLQIISKRGLNFYASFPQMEKTQQIRITVILLIFPILISWLIFLINKTIKLIKNEYTK